MPRFVKVLWNKILRKNSCRPERTEETGGKKPLLNVRGWFTLNSGFFFSVATHEVIILETASNVKKYGDFFLKE